MRARTGRRVCLRGWFGHGNSGDDALLAMASSLVAEVSPDLTTTLLVPRNAPLPPLSAPADITPLGRRFKGHPYLANLWGVWRSDALLFGGGSTMSDSDTAWLTGMRLIARQCRVARARGIPVFFAALGLGPLTTREGRALAREILESASCVEVRDTTSHELCREIAPGRPLVQGFDPAVLLPERPPVTRRRAAATEGTTVGVALSASCGTTAVDKRERLKRVAEGLRRAADGRRLRVAAIQMCADVRAGDHETCEQLRDALAADAEVDLIAYDPDPREVLRRLSQCDAIIAERLHAAIYAYTLGLPFAVISYHDKCRAFARDVGLPPAAVLPADAPPDAVASVLGRLLDAPDELAAELAVERARDVAREGRRALAQALARELVG